MEKEIFDCSFKRKRSNTCRRPRPDHNQNQFVDEKKLRKVKLKLGGVTLKPRPKLILQDTSDDDDDQDQTNKADNFAYEGGKKHRTISSFSKTNDGYDHGPAHKKESVETLMEGRKETLLTTRQRALQSGRDGSAQTSIEFPNGLPPPLPKKQKEKVSQVEQQLKKAEAAQRRRMQVEKAARESEAEAIRKILGQDSSRKKREDRNKKRRDKIAQEKAANATTLPPNTIRWAISPAGTVVTFPQEMGLPSIFSSKPCSYPPPREKCAGPLCMNTYKYRDSKSNLPLCSLQCYKAVNGWAHPVSTF